MTSHGDDNVVIVKEVDDFTSLTRRGMNSCDSRQPTQTCHSLIKSVQNALNYLSHLPVPVMHKFLWWVLIIVRVCLLSWLEETSINFSVRMMIFHSSYPVPPPPPPPAAIVFHRKTSVKNCNNNHILIWIIIRLNEPRSGEKLSVLKT